MLARAAMNTGNVHFFSDFGSGEHSNYQQLGDCCFAFVGNTFLQVTLISLDMSARPNSVAFVLVVDLSARR
jgi:hypothetical protein